MDRQQLLKICRDELYCAVVADTLDSFGLHAQAIPSTIRPLQNFMKLVGFARVGIYMPIYHHSEQVNVYEHTIRLVDSLRQDEVPVLSCNGDRRITPWGELLSMRAQYLGAAGCITDGCVRDASVIRKMKFPVFAAGCNPVDTKYRGKLMWTDVPCVIGGVSVNSGDLVIADCDGVVFIPSDIADKVVAESRIKVQGENTVREELRSGMTLNEVFERHGIL